MSLVVKFLPTLKHVINVNSPKKFHRTMNETESDAQASYFDFFAQRRINSDHLHSAAILRCERAKMPVFANWDGAPLGVGALCRLHTLCIGSGSSRTEKHDRYSNKL